jgi:predicted RNA-binding Zn-ribbon protein involved in translation (DUF1610 family)
MGARFFCENCGAEVKRNSKTCPHCGRSFADILCPACGFTGEARLFSAGCPVCGYTAAPASEGENAAPPKSAAARPKPGGRNAASRKFAAGAPPAWAYLLALLTLAGVLALLLTR